MVHGILELTSTSDVVFHDKGVRDFTGGVISHSEASLCHAHMDGPLSSLSDHL